VRILRASVDFDVVASMRDGTELRANIFRPEGSGPWPVLLTRLPYSKDDPSWFDWLDPVAAVRRGFIVVAQDTRGRFASSGEWMPFHHERRDGYDTVEWAARLPGTNGNVGMFGASYFGATQWLAAMEKPPALKAMAPSMTWSEPLDGLFVRGGAMELGLALSWAVASGFDHLTRKFGGDAGHRIDELLREYDRLPDESYWAPLNGDESVVAQHGLVEIGSVQVLGDLEQAGVARIAGNEVGVATLNLGGWYDPFIQGTLDNYHSMSQRGLPTRLVIGPWAHAAAKSGVVGDLDFGLNSAWSGAMAHEHGDLVGEQLAWFERHLTTSAVAPEMDRPPVRVFLMGRNRWQDHDTWPPANVRSQCHFLRADGSLTLSSPSTDEANSTFAFDPADPVMTRGGAVAMHPSFRSGPVDQSGVESRRDVLVFSSQPLDQVAEVAGRIRAVLHVSSSAATTDWVARLCDVHPDGRSYNVCDGILRVTEGAQSPQERAIDLWSTYHAFLPGHRVRLQVTSSCFPRWDRNTNTGLLTRSEVADQTVFHRFDRASYLELPVVATGV
jgi:putative CocE/NonD family hydrolase